MLGATLSFAHVEHTKCVWSKLFGPPMALAFVGQGPCTAAPAAVAGKRAVRQVPQRPSPAAPLATAAVFAVVARRNQARIRIRSQGSATKYSKLVEEDRMITIEET